MTSPLTILISDYYVIGFSRGTGLSPLTLLGVTSLFNNYGLTAVNNSTASGVSFTNSNGVLSSPFFAGYQTLSPNRYLWWFT
jgi:hypothetical protein